MMMNNTPLVSAILSTYNSEIFIEGKLTDLLDQTIAANLEIIIVNSGSLQNEEKVVKKFLKNNSNIIYIRTENRETIYQAWNRGIKAASGEFITNANTDDRLRKDALEILSSYLMREPDVALVYADQYISNIPNVPFSEVIPKRTQGWNDYSLTRLLEASLAGPQPMWRASLHFKDNIWFDEKLEVAGDYDFACQVGLKYKLKHISKVLGSYYLSDAKQNKEYQNTEITFEETYNIRNKYTDQFISNLSLKELTFKKKYYDRWSNASTLLFYFWKLIIKILAPNKRLETREFVAFLSAKINYYTGDYNKAIINCKKFLENSKSKIISKYLSSISESPIYDIQVSVIMPTYERPNLLRYALESLENQTFKKFEVLVINNGPTKVLEVVNEFSKSLNIKYFDSDIIGSVSHAKNIGLKNSSGKYIAYLDDDDWYHSDHLKILYSELEKNKNLVVYSDAYVELQSESNGIYSTEKKFIEYSKNFSNNLLLVKDYIFTPCVMHHRICYEIVGPFDEKLTTDEDMDMWIRMSRLYKFYHIPKVTCSVRRLKNNQSLTRDWQKMYNNAKYLNEKHHNLGKHNPFVIIGRWYYLNLRQRRAIAQKNNVINNYY